MKKQIHLPFKFTGQEQKRTKNILKRIKQTGNITEYQRVKYFLLIANMCQNAGYMTYTAVLDTIKQPLTLFDCLKSFGYYQLVVYFKQEDMPINKWNDFTETNVFGIKIKYLYNLNYKEIHKAIIFAQELLYKRSLYIYS